MFSSRAGGKWILAGEHAVLRGSPALVFPLAARSMTLSYEAGPGRLRLDYSGSQAGDLKLLAWGVIESALQRLGRDQADVSGSLHLESELPMGSGLGASAALCVVVARWCEELGFLPGSEVVEFARGLEDLFHGESSGVDIAVALSGKGLCFIRGKVPQPLEPIWWPKLFLSYSGQRGVTSECVNRVKSLHKRDAKLGAELDERMRLAVQEAQAALLSSNVTDRLVQLTKAINQAAECFNAWGLCEGQLSAHRQMLLAHGALAVKPTGSGGGGYMLSLWSEAPPADLPTELLPAFTD